MALRGAGATQSLRSTAVSLLEDLPGETLATLQEASDMDPKRRIDDLRDPGIESIPLEQS